MPWQRLIVGSATLIAGKQVAADLPNSQPQGIRLRRRSQGQRARDMRELGDGRLDLRRRRVLGYAEHLVVRVLCTHLDAPPKSTRTPAKPGHACLA
jgi:hypothetical protein